MRIYPDMFYDCGEYMNGDIRTCKQELYSVKDPTIRDKACHADCYLAHFTKTFREDWETHVSRV